MRTPPIRVDFLIFVSQSRLEGATMQIQFDDIAGGKRLLRQVAEEQFVHDTRTGEAHRTLLLASGMGRHHYAARDLLGADRHRWTVVEAAHHLAFWTPLVLIGRQMQARLDQRMIEDGVLFAARHEGEPSEVREDRPVTILAVKPQQGPLR
jgi:hypothetical protein